MLVFLLYSEIATKLSHRKYMVEQRVYLFFMGVLYWKNLRLQSLSRRFCTLALFQSSKQEKEPHNTLYTPPTLNKKSY